MSASRSRTARPFGDFSASSALAAMGYFTDIGVILPQNAGPGE